MIERTEHRVAVPYLPESARGLRVVQLTDIHRSHYTPDRLLHRAVALANALAPDLILLTGDFVNEDPVDIAPCAQILSALHAPLGVYATLGNHDYNAGAADVGAALTHAGITMLVNRSVHLRNGLWIVGLDDDRLGKPDVGRAFAGVPERAPALVLLHNPAWSDRLAGRECVVFTGHTHGGQIRLPYLTARFLRKIGAGTFSHGWYTVGSARVYVNRGIGHVGLPLRFRCHSEISLFILE